MKHHWLKNKICSTSLYKRFWGKESPYDRLILVCGMARTGTSAFTSYIGSHPDVKLVVSSLVWYNAENDLLNGVPDWETVDRLLKEYSPHRILLKKPWVEGIPSLFERISPKNTVVCYRDRESLYCSWNRTEHVGLECKLRPDIIYENDLPMCYKLVEKGALRMSMESMGNNQEKILGKHLRLDPAGFDSTRIQKRWSGRNEREWLEKHAIWVERKR